MCSVSGSIILIPHGWLIPRMAPIVAAVVRIGLSQLGSSGHMYGRNIPSSATAHEGRSSNSYTRAENRENLRGKYWAGYRKCRLETKFTLTQKFYISPSSEHKYPVCILRLFCYCFTVTFLLFTSTFSFFILRRLTVVQL